jgi:hypothetical protein
VTDYLLIFVLLLFLILLSLPSLKQLLESLKHPATAGNARQSATIRDNRYPLVFKSAV